MTIENHSLQSLQASILDGVDKYSWEDLPSQGSCTDNVDVFPMKRVRVIIDKLNSGDDEIPPNNDPTPQPIDEDPTPQPVVDGQV